MNMLLAPLDGRITLKGLLGTGGMGEVFRAWDVGLERPLAVKFVRNSDAKEADRLLLEARLQARVEHPNVVRVYDTGTLEGRPCILLQLVEGRTLADLPTEIHWRTKVALAAQAARGLGAAHRMGLTHRDVKPANILVEESKDGFQARLSDFGLARDEEGGLTRSGLLMGTVDFMAPEQVTGSVPVDFRADIYGLGATLYAVLSGRPPFRNTPGSTAAAPETHGLDADTPEGDLHPGDLLRRVLEEEPRSLIAQVPGLPRDLATVVAKAMEKQPSRRYVTAEALADDLEHVLHGEPIQARPLGWTEKTVRWARRNPLAARAVSVGLIAVLSAGAFAAWNNRRSTLAALDAAQLGGEAKAFELRLRMAYLAPAHDLRPVHAELRAGLAHMQNRKGAAQAAGDYARGMVLTLLDDLEGAQKALEQARRRGFKGADLDEALGFVYGRRYVRILPQVEALKDPSLKAQQKETLRKTFKAPAMAHLIAAGNTLYEQAFMALMDKRFEEARSLAQRARREDPERIDATLIEGQAWQQEAHEAQGKLDHLRTAVCVTEGLRVGESLLLDLRSDPEVPLLLARLKVVEAATAQQLGKPAQKPFEEGIAWTDRALALDPDWAETWKVRGSLFEVMGQEAVTLGSLQGIHYSEQQVEACRRAVALQPADAEAHRTLARALHILGVTSGQLQKDPLLHFREGQKEALLSEKLEPWHPSGPHLALLNALDESAYRVTHSLDASSSMAEAEGILVRLRGMPGLLPTFLHRGIADLRGLQAQVAARNGKDPDPLRAEAQVEYESLLKMEPDHLVRTMDVLFGAVTWGQERSTAGRSVGEIWGRVEPVLNAGLKHWPEQPMLLYYRAYLLALRLFDPKKGGGMEAQDPILCKEALAAFQQARVAMKNPAVMEIHAWILLALAEADQPGAAELARAAFQHECERDPTNPIYQVGVARALRLRGQPGDLALAWTHLETLAPDAKADPEVMLVQGLVRMEGGHPEEGRALEARALSLQPLLAGYPALRIKGRSDTK
jgi:serine/threonine-protein kinase